MSNPGMVNESGFRTVAGMKLVYEPENQCGQIARKYPCKDCHSCQFCSEARFMPAAAMGEITKRFLSRKLSICEQIQLFDAIKLGRDGNR
jgi:hypothetical protein